MKILLSHVLRKMFTRWHKRHEKVTKMSCRKTLMYYRYVNQLYFLSISQGWFSKKTKGHINLIWYLLRYKSNLFIPVYICNSNTFVHKLVFWCVFWINSTSHINSLCRGLHQSLEMYPIMEGKHQTHSYIYLIYFQWES